MTGLLRDEHAAVAGAMRLAVTGRVSGLTGLTVLATGLNVPVGATCEIDVPGAAPLPAEVIGFHRDATVLMPLGAVAGMAQGQAVRCLRASQRVRVGPGLLGRVIDALGQPLDGQPPPRADHWRSVRAAAPPALERGRIEQPLSVGIRSINALLTPGRGQRLGIFAGTGVGKSVLLGMMARNTSADVAVVALVGERGREVRDFIERDLGEAGLRRSVVVVATSDQSAVLRVRAAFVATAVAEYFRDQGADVLLLMDSVTRVAMAQRQIGLAVGEPPTTRGYTPSVYSLLPELLERSGRAGAGSITGLYSVLVEGDDLNEPLSDAVRGILDGHIWLSRKLATRAHYPAVSVTESISRCMPDVVGAEHLRAARRVQRLVAVWEDIADLVNVGAYVAGANVEYDLAIQARPLIDRFLQQGMDESADFEAARVALAELDRALDGVEAELRRAGQSPRDSGPRPAVRTERPAAAGRRQA